MQKHYNRNHAQSVFGVHQIPKASQIGNLLDPITPETLYPVLAEVGDRLYAQDCSEPFIRISGTLLVALEKSRWNGMQRLAECYRYLNQVPLQGSDDALLVNGCEAAQIFAKQDVVYRNAWATSHAIDEHNAVQTVAAGRARGKVENENNDVLENHGYHFDHNFAHGKQHLTNFLSTLDPLAFLAHTAMDL